jgi:hypothetical protein
MRHGLYHFVTCALLPSVNNKLDLNAIERQLRTFGLASATGILTTRTQAYRARLAFPPQSLLPSPPLHPRLACGAPDREGHTQSALLCSALFQPRSYTLQHSLSILSLRPPSRSVWTRFRLLLAP